MTTIEHESIIQWLMSPDTTTNEEMARWLLRLTPPEKVIPLGFVLMTFVTVMTIREVMEYLRNAKDLRSRRNMAVHDAPPQNAHATGHDAVDSHHADGTTGQGPHATHEDVQADATRWQGDQGKEEERRERHPDMTKDKFKQVIVVRADLGMSHGKMAAQVSHASMAFLTNALREGARRLDSQTVRATCDFDYDLWSGWVNGTFTKVVLKAKNRGDIERLMSKAEAAGMREGRDFFPIRDICLTELTPETEDGRCLTCVGFRPMRASDIDVVTRRYRLFAE